MPGQARLRAQCAAGLRLRHGETGNFRRSLQRLDARRFGAVETRARDDRGGGVVAEPLLLLPDGARRVGAAIFRQCAARRADGDELPCGTLESTPTRDARLRRQADGLTGKLSLI